MPFYGLSSFLQTDWWSPVQIDMLCQCPSMDFLHFYIKQFLGRRLLLCQCPSMDFLHFYIKKGDIIRLEKRMYQCPSTSFLHFYSYRTPSYEAMAKSINALQQAFFISTEHTNILLMKDAVCINALQRAFFISTYDEIYVAGEAGRVSIPFNGLSSFLLLVQMDFKKHWIWYQCPSTSFLHFYSQESQTQICI